MTFVYECLLPCDIVVTSGSVSSLMSALDKLYRDKLNNGKGLEKFFCIHLPLCSAIIVWLFPD